MSANRPKLKLQQGKAQPDAVVCMGQMYGNKPTVSHCLSTTTAELGLRQPR